MRTKYNKIFYKIIIEVYKKFNVIIIFVVNFFFYTSLTTLIHIRKRSFKSYRALRPEGIDRLLPIKEENARLSRSIVEGE